MYKFVIGSSALSSALTVVSKAIINRNSMPILDNVLLERHDVGFTVTGASSENELTRILDNLQITEGSFFPVCINAGQLLSIITQLPEQPLAFAVADDFRVTVDYDNGQFEVPGHNPEAYPHKVFDRDGRFVSFRVNAKQFLGMVSGAATCVTKDFTIRPAMAAVCVDTMQDGYVVVGTDGHKMYRESCSPGVPFLKEGQPMKILFPGSVIRIVQAAFANSENIDIESNERIIRLSSSDTLLYLTTIDTVYPDYNKVLPENQSYHITLHLKEFTSALKRVILFASLTTRLVMLTVKGNNSLRLSTQDIDFGCQAGESVACSEISAPEGFQIAFNADNLLSLLGNMACADIRLQMTEPLRPLTMREEDAKSSLVLMLMPMYINE